ncbi:MAG: type II secretion system protein J, partial [Opitutales bacterium]
MVATAIMVVLIGLVIQITSSVLNVWNRSVDKLASNAQARIAMELITSDLETAVIRHNDLRWLESTQEAMLNPLDIPTLQTTRLALFAPAMDRLQITTDDDDKPIPIPGDVCAISYELVYQDPVDGEDDENDNIFSLHRRVIDAKTTF